MRRVCIFHAGCPDGFGAAWAAWRVWGEDARYIPRGHEDELEPRRYEGDVVAFVDISPHNDVLAELVEVAEQVVILDHHITARTRFHEHPTASDTMAEGGHVAHFDLNHSGAILSWDYFHPGKSPPELLRYVEDQDLWSWKLPQSEQVNAALGSYPRDFEVWERLAARPIEDLAAEGESLVRGNQIEVDCFVEAVA